MAGTRIGKPAVTPAQAKRQAEMAQREKAELAFQKLMESGKVKDINKARTQIQKKYGFWPNGMTN